ncbi:ABC transporter permease [Anaerosacchariphilus polymeriproducens]|uniref:Transport permease protein n=1 Tax=Anaerosacchariphilus polymeriproducens TaxID=1812858 RepID=A0A371AR90_9FIRM|nr:ABC transporter permease [Anaerosacchariphilus polymeriproducens]RDU22096.1 polysaccharide ABC transporter [Anaerosacchariphilus polymeriproducens]
MKRFLNDVKKYWAYTKYSAKSGLKSEVASSRLSWLWWILDPLMFMMIYVFIAKVIGSSKLNYFEVFVFIGLSIWNFFNKTITDSVKIVSANSAIVSKVYIPKYMLILSTLMQYAFKMFISFSLVVIMMIVYRVPVTWNYLYFIPILLTLFLITFAISTIVAHLGVFIEDLKNVIQILLRLVFYLSGIFYSLESKLKLEPLLSYLLLKLNPSACLIQECRNVLLYNKGMDIKIVLAWFIVGLAFSALGIRTIYKYENSYVKVI